MDVTEDADFFSVSTMKIASVAEDLEQDSGMLKGWPKDKISSLHLTSDHETDKSESSRESGQQMALMQCRSL